MPQNVPLMKDETLVGWNIIWKVRLPRVAWNVPFELGLPKGARIILVEPQGEEPMVWVKFPAINRDSVETRKFAIVGTGTSFPDTYSHVGSWQEPPLVYHLFEVTP